MGEGEGGERALFAVVFSFFLSLLCFTWCVYMCASVREKAKREGGENEQRGEDIQGEPAQGRGESGQGEEDVLNLAHPHTDVHTIRRDGQDRIGWDARRHP